MRFGRISDLDRFERPSESGSILLEDERRFFQYRPVVVSNDPVARHQTPEIWNHVRYRHSTLIQEIGDCFVFGSNFVVDQGGNIFCDEMRFRRGAFEFYRGFIRGLSPDLPECVFSEGGLFLDWRRDALRNAIAIESPVYLLTPIEQDNWGRWLCQVLPRLEHIKQFDPDYRILIRCGAPWQRRFLQFCGVDPARIIEHDPGKIYRIRQLKMFRHSAVDFTASIKEMDIYARIAARFRKTGQSAKNIFLSRRNASLRNKNYRVLQNEDKFIEALKQLDFVSIDPEMHSIEEQISWLATAQNIVGLGGSAIFNAVFCRDDAHYITVESQPTFIATHTGLLASLSLWHGVVFGRPVDLDQCGVNAHANWTLDIDRAMSAIAQGLGR
jgi:capsular polysaccharide biosynthesis protein